MQDYVMKCEEFDINLAENVRLFAPIKFGSKIYEKGHALTKEDILIFKMHDVRRIFGAVMDDGDISYQTAEYAALFPPLTAYSSTTRTGSPNSTGFIQTSY